MDTLDYILASLDSALIVLFVRHLLLKERDKRERFEKAAEELRKAFSICIAELSRGDIFDMKYISDDMIKLQHGAVINFRNFLNGKKLEEYDDAWKIYNITYKDLGAFGGYTSKEVLEDIEEILKYTKY